MDVLGGQGVDSGVVQRAGHLVHRFHLGQLVGQHLRVPTQERPPIETNNAFSGIL
jgi:hypothetical protein